MSKKKTSKRLESIFDNVEKEEIKPTKRSAKTTEPSKPPFFPPPARPKADDQLKPVSPRLEEVPAVTSAVSSSSGAMSLAFRQDEKNWATLRVVDDAAPRTWAMEEQMLVKQVADQLSLALENARLFQETQKALAETQSLYEASAELNAAQSFDEIIEVLRRHTVLNRASIGRLMQFDQPWNDQQTPETMRLIADWPSDPSNPSRRAANLSVQNFPAVKFLSPHEPTIIEDVSTDKRLDPNSRTLIAEQFRAQSALFAPLTMGKDWIGYLAAYYPEKTLFTRDELQHLMSLIRQASIAIEKTRLFEETRRREAEALLLNRIVTTVSSSLNIQESLQYVASEIANLVSALHVGIALANEDKTSLILRADAPVRADGKSDINLVIPVAGNPTAEPVIKEGKTLFINNVQSNPLTAAIRDVMKLRGTNSLFIWPIFAGQEVIGSLGVDFAEPDRRLSENEENLISTILLQTSTFLQNSKLFEATQRTARQMSVLAEVGQDISASLDLQTVLEKIAQHAKESLNAFSSAVYIPESDNRILHAFVAIGDEAEQIKKDPVKVGEGILGSVALTKSGAIFNEAMSDARALVISGTVQLSHEHLMAVPVLSGDKLTGIMAVWRTGEGIGFQPSELEFLTGLARQAAIAIENARLFEATRESQKAVERSEAELRALFAAMTDVIIVNDKEGRYLRIAPTNPSRLFLPPDELIGQKIPDILPPETAGPIMAAIDHALKTGEQAKLEYMLNINEKNYWFDATISKLNEEQVFLVARDVSERKRNELIQNAITQISEAALTSQDTPSLLKVIHESVASLMPARNFYVCLYDERTDMMTFPYYVDEHDEAWPPQKPGRGLTSYVLRTGKPILVTPDLLDEMERAGEVKAGGTRGTDWMGAPLRSGTRRLGVMAVQSYDPEVRLTETDLDALVLIANQASIAIERKRSQEELAKFKLGIDHSDDAVFITDPDGTILYANPGFEKVYGYKQEEVIGQNPRLLQSGKMSRDYYKHLWDTLLSKNTVTGEVTNRKKDGQLISVAETSSPILDDNNNIIGFLSVHHDMTATKQAEEALKRRNEYLAASAEIGRLVTSTLDLNAIFSRTVNLVSERFGYYHAAIFIVEETGFNVVLREGTGSAGAEMKRNHHSLPVNEHSIVGKVALTGEPVVVNNTALDSTHKPNPLLPDTRAEAAIPLRVGSRIIGALDIQSTSVGAFTSDDLAVLQILADQVAVAIDNARSYELSQQAVKEMREVDRVKSQFLANMSHELRTPLNSIIGFSRVILKGIDGPISDLQQQDLTAIYNSGQHLLGLINDVLDLAKIEAGKMELAFDQVNMSDLIASVMSTASGLVKDKNIKLVKNVHGELPPVRADAIRIRQVLLNLLSNAAKFTDEGEIIVDASVETGTNGRPEILVSVTDTGPGIAPEDQAKLFQPFSQVDDSPTRKTGGTGLGLSISHQLIQMHGGRIGVHSAIGKGSTFYFTLPVYRGKEETAESSEKKVVLAIDDDPQVISLYERYLQPQGYQVVALTDPTRAKERARQLKPFAITLDIMMPGYDGWAVLTELKANSETRDIPVIICSIIEEQERGFSLGAADYLLKPILEEDLLGALDRLNADGSIHEVLVIDDDANALRLIGKIFENHQRYKLTLCDNGPKGWELLTSHPPQAVILDLYMPDMNGFTILEKMRENAKLRDIPVVVVSGGELTPEQQKQLNEFGQRLITKGALNESDLLGTLERALRRMEVKK
jgi:PAS domain S-box-containing protein